VTPAGHATPPHVHSREDEAFYVVDGDFEMTAGDQVLRAGPGSYVHLPKGLPHAFRNAGTVEGRLLAWVFPANLEGFFAALDKPLPAGRNDPFPVDDRDRKTLQTLCERYGIGLLA
jgi:quercetin dioxygenase-like cupin family protein